MTIFQSGRLINSCYVWHGMVSSLRQNPIWWRYSYRADGPLLGSIIAPQLTIFCHKIPIRILYCTLASGRTRTPRRSSRLVWRPKQGHCWYWHGANLSPKYGTISEIELLFDICENYGAENFTSFSMNYIKGSKLRLTFTFTNSDPRYFLISKV